MATNAKKASQQHTKMHTRLMRDNKPSKQIPEILRLRNDKTWDPTSNQGQEHADLRRAVKRLTRVKQIKKSNVKFEQRPNTKQKKTKYEK